MLPDTCTTPNEGHKAHKVCVDSLVAIEELYSLWRRNLRRPF